MHRDFTAAAETPSSPARMQRLVERFRELPEGKALLDLAERKDCAIFFGAKQKTDEGIVLSGRGGVLSLREMPFLDTDLPGMRLTPEHYDKGFDLRIDAECSDDEVLELLAHELRHLWQYQTLPPEKTLNLSIPFRMAVTRVLEGDAYTFQRYIKERLENPAVKGPEDFDWRASFVAFQESRTAVEYDRMEINRSRVLFATIKYAADQGQIDMETAKTCAAAVFNSAALDQLALLKDITVAGLAPGASNYLGISSNETLRKTLKCMDEKDLEIAEQSMQGVHPGRPVEKAMQQLKMVA